LAARRVALHNPVDVDPSEKFEAQRLFNRGLRGYLGCGIGKTIAFSIRVIRVIRGSILREKTRDGEPARPENE
jgi:hypothetical protein